MKLALHACCGPCLLEPFDDLSAIADVTVVYANSNIHPVSEYELRLDTLLAYAAQHAVHVVQLTYDPAKWLATAGFYAADKTKRCSACYELRLGETAAWARANGYDALATTLTVSPYQDQSSISKAGRSVAEEYGLEWIDRDYRARYEDATRRSRELEMYRQNYCGCIMSDVEARAERAARKAARRKEREAARSVASVAAPDEASEPATEAASETAHD